MRQNLRIKFVIVFIFSHRRAKEKIVHDLCVNYIYRNLIIFKLSLKSNQNSQVNKPQTWNQKELAGLVQYVALFHDSSGSERWQWPVHKNNTFWKQCAEAVSTYSGKPLRSRELIILCSVVLIIYIMIYVCLA